MSAGTALKQIVTFRLGSDLFAADIFTVERVLRYIEPRTVPRLPEWIEGVVDYDSAVVPVVDLRKRFELSDALIGGSARLLILSIEGEFIGAIVDEVLDVLPVGEGELSPPPQIFRGLSAEYLLGLARRGDAIVLVLDFGHLFSSSERIVLQKLSSGESLG